MKGLPFIVVSDGRVYEGIHMATPTIPGLWGSSPSS